MTWRIPHVGEKLWINPEFANLAWRSGWHKHIWFMWLRDGGSFLVEAVDERGSSVGIRLAESPIEVSVSKDNGNICGSDGPQMFLFESDDGRILR